MLTTPPIGLFITFQLAQIDFSTLAALGQLASVVFAATLFHGLIVLPAIAWLVSGMNPLQFLRAVSQPAVTPIHLIQRRHPAAVHEHGTNQARR